MFRAAVCQSPSFWWERGRFAEQLPVAPPAGREFWIFAGSSEPEAGVSHPPSRLRQDLTQVAGCVSTVAGLPANGYRVNYGEYDGGHDPLDRQRRILDVDVSSHAPGVFAFGDLVDNVYRLPVTAAASGCSVATGAAHDPQEGKT